MTSVNELTQLHDVVKQMTDDDELTDMAAAVRQAATSRYRGAPRLPLPVRQLLDAIADRRIAVMAGSSETKADLTKTKHDDQVALPVVVDPPPAPPAVVNLPPAPVVVNLVAPTARGTYDLRIDAKRAEFIDVIKSTKSNLVLTRAAAAFAAAASGPPNAESDFPDVRKALDEKKTEFATTETFKGYAKLTGYSHSGRPLLGSVRLRRVELLEAPSASDEKADRERRGYAWDPKFRPGMKSDRAEAVATRIANLLHEHKVHGVELRQVVKIKDGTNEVYHLNIKIPRAGDETTPPAKIDVTVDAMTVDDAAAGEVVDVNGLGKELSGRILQLDEEMTLYPESNVIKDPMPPRVIRGKEWRTTDIDILKRVVGLIPEDHWKVLSGLKFVRVGDFGDGQGETAAEYFPSDPPVICISDKVTDPNYTEYLYDEKSGKVESSAVRLIAHELGHALSYEKWREAAHDYKRSAVKVHADMTKVGGFDSDDALPLQPIAKFVEEGEYVTDYAAGLAVDDGRTGKARSELFAEAYSLWITRPAYLKEKHPKLAELFEKQKF